MGQAALDVTMPDKITVCGGGNGAQALAVIAASTGCEVDIYAPYADEASRLQMGCHSNQGIACVGAIQARGIPRRISADPGQVIPGSAMVFLVAPAFTHASMLEAIVPHLDSGAWVGAVPARGGFDWTANKVLRRYQRHDVRLFGLQTLPWSCRIEDYGVRVRMLGSKRIVDFATRPAAQADALQPVLQTLLRVPMGQAGSFLALTLANVGQLIHPGIMYSLFADWDGQPFRQDERPLFYHSLDESGARLLQGMSDEIQEIRHRLEPPFDLRAVRPLHQWLLRSYADDIADPGTLWSSFVSNRAYAGLLAPMKELTPGAWVPDFSARYLAEDAPFGLAVSHGIARLCGAKTPHIDAVLQWAGERLGRDLLDVVAPGLPTPQNAGIQRIDSLA